MASVPALNLNQTHYLPASLPGRFGLGTTVYWSYRPAQSLLVFVHGFGGDATSTWRGFPGFLTSDPQLASTDVIFYGYNAKTDAANPSALAFLAFLELVLASPTAFMKDILGESSRNPNQEYQRIVVVAHSLGAVVIRRALLWAAQKAHPWVQRIRMVLFAPAHNGAYAAVLASNFLTGDSGWFLAKVLGHAALYKVPLLQDLQPGSVILTSLLNDTRAALAAVGAAAAPPTHLAAEAVVWAQDDRVVINAPFERDRIPELFNGKDHLSVCKPSPDFRGPMDVVLRALS